MKKLLLFLMLLPSLVSAQNSSELVARWGVSFNWWGFTYSPDITYHNGAAGTITAGNISGSNVSYGIDFDGYSGSNWASSQTTPDYTKYIQFTVAPAAGKNLTPKHFRFQQTGVCRKFQVRYSTNPSFPGNGTLLMQVDNATSVQDSFINVPFPGDITVTSGQTLYIRVYGYYRSSGSSWSIRHDGALSGSAPEFYGVISNNLTANPDTASTYQGIPVNINVAANDVVSGTTISNISISSPSSKGTAVVQPDKSITFTPNAGYTGTTSFQYTATAANGGTSSTTVTVTVSPLVLPAAVNDAVTLIKNTTAQISALNNDTTGSGTITSVAVTLQPAHGTVYFSNNIAYYTPALNYTGTDTFKYAITNSFNHTSTGTVNLTVNEPVLPSPGLNTGVYCPSSTTWNGTSWSNGTPVAGKDVIFTGNYTQNGGTLTACSIHVTGNAQVLFKNNSNAIVTYSVNVAATASLTFESSSNLVQVENTPNTGNVTVKRYGSKLKRLDYTLWSSPVAGTQTLLEFSPATVASRFYTYNTQNNSYLSVGSSATTTFTPGKGYLIRMPDEIEGVLALPYSLGLYRFSFLGVFTGVPNTGTIQIPLEYYSDSNRYNGVGNPYPSPISVSAFIDANIANIEGTIWIWRKTNNPNETSYCTLTKFGYVGNNAPGGGGSNGNDGNDLIADPFSINPQGVLNTGQGFIIKSKNNQSLVFNNSMRRTNNYANFFRNDEADEAQPTTTVADASRIWLNVTNSTGESFSQAMIGYTPEATLGYDNGLDGNSMSGGSVNLYSIVDNMKLIIQARPEFTDTDVVQLGFKSLEAGEFNFAIDHVDGLFTGEQQIYIKDNVSGTIHNLKESSYYFTTEAGTFESRFEIVYMPNALGTGTNIVAQNDIVLFSNNKKVGFRSAEEVASLTIYSIEGKQIYRNNSLTDSEFITDQLNVATQAVIVNLTFINGTAISRKVMLE
jgi:hypothetical protein